MIGFGGLISVNIHNKDYISLLGRQGPVYGISISARLYEKLRRGGYEIYPANDDPKYDKMMRERAESQAKKETPKVNKAEEIIEKDLKAIEAAEEAKRLEELAEMEKNRQAAIELQKAFVSAEVEVDDGEEFELPEAIINEPEVEDEPVEVIEESTLIPEDKVEESSTEVNEETLDSEVENIEESTPEPEVEEFSMDEDVINSEIEKALEGFVPLEEIHDTEVETSFMDDLEDNFKKHEEEALRKIELAEAQLAKKLAKEASKTEEDALIEEALGEEEVEDVFDNIDIKPLPPRDGVHMTHRKSRIDYTIDDGIDRSGMKKFTEEELTVKSKFSREDLIKILHERGYKPGHMWYGRHHDLRKDLVRKILESQKHF